MYDYIEEAMQLGVIEKNFGCGEILLDSGEIIEAKMDFTVTSWEVAYWNYVVSAYVQSQDWICRTAGTALGAYCAYPYPEGFIFPDSE